MTTKTYRLLIANIADTAARMLENAIDLDPDFSASCPKLEAARQMLCEIEQDALNSALDACGKLTDTMP